MSHHNYFGYYQAQVAQRAQAAQTGQEAAQVEQTAPSEQTTHAQTAQVAPTAQATHAAQTSQVAAHAHQYQYPELNGFQVLSHQPVAESFQGSWYSNAMSWHGHHPAIYQQRAPGGYDEWSLPGHVYANIHANAVSPGPVVPGALPSTPPTITSSTMANYSTAHTPNTPSPNAMPNGLSNQNSPTYYTPFTHRTSADYNDSETANHQNSENNNILHGAVALEPARSPLLGGLRPHQPRSPYEWMRQRSFHTSPNDHPAEEVSYAEMQEIPIKTEEITYAEIPMQRTDPTEEPEDQREEWRRARQEEQEDSWKVEASQENDDRETSWKTAGKTRTKDKYRVVYSDQQRLELEKEFHYSRYITIRRKAELANMLALSERQVKIWFQNRRAKERKQAKKNNNNNIEHHPYHPGLALGHQINPQFLQQQQQQYPPAHPHYPQGPKRSP